MFSITMNVWWRKTHSKVAQIAEKSNLHIVLSFKLITRVSREDKRAQIMVGKWNKKERKKKEDRTQHPYAVVTCEIKLFWNNFCVLFHV